MPETDGAIVVEVVPDFDKFRAAVQNSAKDLAKTTGMRVTIHEGNLRRFMESQAGPIGRKVQAVASEIAIEAAYTAPLDTGNLRRSIKVRQGTKRNRSGASVVADTPYAVFMEKGTKPHVIRARRAPYLVFPKNGTIWYRKKVNHPGTQPYRFMENALRKAVRR